MSPSIKTLDRLFAALGQQLTLAVEPLPHGDTSASALRVGLQALTPEERARSPWPLAISLVEGTPDRLPSVALDSTALLHALRAGALFAIGFTVATVLARAAAGRLPTQLSTTGIGYGAEETRETTTALVELQEQVDDQQALLDGLAEQLDALGSKF